MMIPVETMTPIDHRTPDSLGIDVLDPSDPRGMSNRVDLPLECQRISDIGPSTDHNDGSFSVSTYDWDPDEGCLYCGNDTYDTLEYTPDSSVTEDGQVDGCSSDSDTDESQDSTHTDDAGRTEQGSTESEDAEDTVRLEDIIPERSDQTGGPVKPNAGGSQTVTLLYRCTGCRGTLYRHPFIDQVLNNSDDSDDKEPTR